MHLIIVDDEVLLHLMFISRNVLYSPLMSTITDDKLCVKTTSFITSLLSCQSRKVTTKPPQLFKRLRSETKNIHRNEILQKESLIQVNIIMLLFTYFYRDIVLLEQFQFSEIIFRRPGSHQIHHHHHHQIYMYLNFLKYDLLSYKLSYSKENSIHYSFNI